MLKWIVAWVFVTCMLQLLPSSWGSKTARWLVGVPAVCALVGAVASGLAILFATPDRSTWIRTTVSELGKKLMEEAMQLPVEIPALIGVAISATMLLVYWRRPKKNVPRRRTVADTGNHASNGDHRSVSREDLRRLTRRERQPALQVADLLKKRS